MDVVGKLERFFNNQAAVELALSDHPKIKGAFTKTIFGLNHVHQLRNKKKDAEKVLISATTHKRELEPQLGVSQSNEIHAEIDKVTKAIRTVKDRLQTELTFSGANIAEHFEYAITQQLKKLGNADHASNLLKPKRDETLVDALVRAVIDGRTTAIPEDIVRNVNRRLRHLEKGNATLLTKKRDLEDELDGHQVDLTNLQNMLADDEDRLTDLKNEYDEAYKEARNARIAMNNLEKEIKDALENTWEAFYQTMRLSPTDAIKFINRYLAKVPETSKSWSLPSI